jgi:hypothetical protein
MLHLEGTTLNFNAVNSVSVRIGNIEFSFNIKSLQFDLITLALFQASAAMRQLRSLGILHSAVW